MLKIRKGEYPLLGKWRCFHLIYGVILGASAVLCFLVLLNKDATFYQKIILAPFLMVITILYTRKEIHRALREKLIITPQGIEYSTFDLNLFGEWKNIKSIVTEKDYFLKITGISISGIRKSNSGTNDASFFIPISIFADKWEDSELGKQIHRYAPHLFE